MKTDTKPNTLPYLRPGARGQSSFKGNKRNSDMRVRAVAALEALGVDTGNRTNTKTLAAEIGMAQDNVNRFIDNLREHLVTKPYRLKALKHAKGVDYWLEARR